jgi:transposase
MTSNPRISSRVVVEEVRHGPERKVRRPLDRRAAVRAGTDVATGRHAAAALTHARALLKADDAAGGGWPDGRVAEALGVSAGTVARVRKRFARSGLEAALHRKKPTGRQYRKLDGAQEARLVALACSEPPAGRGRWAMRLLADKLVEPQVVQAVSDETVRRALKKTRSSRG